MLACFCFCFFFKAEVERFEIPRLILVCGREQKSCVTFILARTTNRPNWCELFQKKHTNRLESSFGPRSPFPHKQSLGITRLLFLCLDGWEFGVQSLRTESKSNWLKRAWINILRHGWFLVAAERDRDRDINWTYL